VGGASGSSSLSLVGGALGAVSGSASGGLSGGGMGGGGGGGGGGALSAGGALFAAVFFHANFPPRYEVPWMHLPVCVLRCGCYVTSICVA
jgi:hypothetical protein